MSADPRYVKISSGRQRFVWFGNRLWWRTYTVGGYDGYRTIGMKRLGNRLPCGELAFRKCAF